VAGGVTAIVLAAGAGRRFGGGKLLARLDGRPILQHVLDALAAAGIDDPVVVLGADADALESAIGWRSARRIRNPDPDRGLAGSLRLGWGAAMTMAARPEPAAVLVVLGDQPRLDPGVVRALVAEPADSRRPVVVARHADGSRNPVRLEPEAAPLVEAATGDRGLGPAIDGHAELVRVIEVDGANPDVDTPADLVGILAADWARRVRDNAAQVDRFRETPDGRDFYATVSRTFVADPARDGDLVLEALLGLARPDETWLDLGAGAGRYALPLARRVRRVVAVDPSGSMLGALREEMAAHGIANIGTVEGRWPPDGALRAALGPNPLADVALIAHVSYDVAEIGPFLDAMEAAARRICVAVLMERNPASVAAPFWPPVHGEERVPLPALPQFVELLEARGTAPDVIRITGERRRWADRDELLTLLRRQLWTAPGSASDARLLAAVGDLAAVDPDGSVSLPGTLPLDIGVVVWGSIDSR
jgi:CTP:molybdopterin cytidylyltransferase MocA/SAM-dependent methyltransferase